MKKYKNVGGSVGFILDGKTYDFVNGEIKEVPDDFKERLESQIAKLEDITGPPTKKIIDEYGKIKVVPVEPEPEVIEVKEPEAKEEKYSRTDLMDMDKKEQTAILKKLGVEKIPGKEADRVKKILEAQE